ncbi:MAG TPA: hypothetical protein VIA45_03510 [Thermoanaerobaculia bacterium]|jgi:hypothetical protein
MEPVVGIFTTRNAAANAARSLRASGFPEDRVQLLLPEGGPLQVERVPTEESEEPGVAPALAAVVGGAAGGALGLGLGTFVASVLVPGAGAVTAIGLAAAGLFGAGGAAGGAVVGEKLEDKSLHGLPRDEIYLYEDALSLGHTIVFAMPKDEKQEEAARRLLESSGAESVDAARERWWIGLREAEKAHYEETTSGFENVEESYRRGFVAGVHPDADEASAQSAADVPDPGAYRRGYARGRARRSAMAETPAGRV